MTSYWIKCHFSQSFECLWIMKSQFVMTRLSLLLVIIKSKISRVQLIERWKFPQLNLLNLMTWDIELCNVQVHSLVDMWRLAPFFPVCKCAPFSSLKISSNSNNCGMGWTFTSGCLILQCLFLEAFFSHEKDWGIELKQHERSIEPLSAKIYCKNKIWSEF